METWNETHAVLRNIAVSKLVKAMSLANYFKSMAQLTCALRPVHVHDTQTWLRACVSY